MSSLQYSQYKNKIITALTTQDLSQLDILRKDKSTNVRRAVAKNKNTPKSIINDLAYDPCKNVSFVAANHPSCEVQRDFWDGFHPCVYCEKNEDELNCYECKSLDEFEYE